ncbi:hypothetical protein Acr_27g0002240 [Actinidia rufa]|uniref:Malectin-like domain-containing protein n=1 Tax=Actinidia rufa TaxID=165716 RepID=A0A7J0H6A1_9ERIC|nr:hypothetical protein Acr_27g0002240 [Actinidia rufa]
MFNTNWLADQFFTTGSAGLLSEPLRYKSLPKKTFRFFPISSGKKNCHTVPVAEGRYCVYTFTVYNNYDGKSRTPSFDVFVKGTLVFSWRSLWPEETGALGTYSDLFVAVWFYSIATYSPVIALLELIQIDLASYCCTQNESPITYTQKTIKIYVIRPTMPTSTERNQQSTIE